MVRRVHEDCGNCGFWELIQYCDYRELEIATFDPWFKKMMMKQGYEKFKHEKMLQLLYPAYRFDDINAFAFFTKSLAYGIGWHIKEDNLTDYRNLHLDGITACKSPTRSV